MKLKYQLRGLGIGLIITTIILTISHSVREIEASSKDNIRPTESTGSILAFDKDAESSQSDDENNKETERQTETDTQQATEPTQAATEPTQAATKPTQAQTEPTQAAAQTGKVVTVNIKDVYYARQAADILYNAGVITDKADFVKYLDKAGYAERISEGTYQIKQGDNYETIAKTICRIK